MKEIILLTISGDDKPGVTSAITNILADYKINILDIGQAVIHNTLSLGILIEVPKEAESSPLLRDVLFKAHELGVNIRFTPVDEESYEHWVEGQGKNRFIVTLLARRITAEHIAKVTGVVASHNLNIDRINRLSGRIPLRQLSEQGRSCVEFSVRGNPENLDQIREQFLSLANELAVDISFQVDDVFHAPSVAVVYTVCASAERIPHNMATQQVNLKCFIIEGIWS